MCSLEFVKITCFTTVRWFPTTMKPSSKETQNKECLDLRQFLLDYKKQKELAEGIGVEEEDPNELGL